MPLVAIPIIGAIAGGAIGAIGSNKAAKTQANAADQAAQLQHQDQMASLQFQKQQYADQQKNEAPWLQAGGQAETSLSNLVQGGGFPDWTQQFQAPTGATEQNDPGYQFRLQQGMQALQNSAAAKGGLLSSGTAKNINDYAQNYASNEYQNVYNRAFNEYSTSYNQFEQNQANKFNRLSSLAGGGQVAANQLGAAGQAAASNIANINNIAGAQQGGELVNAGAARASGYAGVSNQIIGGINSATQGLLLSQLLKGQSINPYVGQTYQGPGGT